jgi:hypothetical protein
MKIEITQGLTTTIRPMTHRVNNSEYNIHAEDSFAEWFHDLYGGYSLRSEWFYGDCKVEDEKTRQDIMCSWIHDAYIAGYEHAHRNQSSTTD